MKLHSFLLGAAALPLIAIAPAQAREAAPESVFAQPAGMPSTLLQLMPDMAGGQDARPVQLAQANDPRVVGLEEQVRQLNGRIEEMNFQILQIQEQMRKMQEDVDFRLQEMEGKRGDAGSAEPARKAEADRPASAEVASTDQAGAVAHAAGNKAGASVRTAPEEKPLGTIVFDESGNVKGGTMNSSATIGTDPAGAEDAGTDDQKVAALPSTDNPGELYRDSYEYVLSGDYGTAEAGFRQHIERYPADPQTADARYWLGEALLGQQRYRDAAEVFVEANREYPDSRKAPDMLLKLGVSLSALNQRDVACATFGKIGERYPKASKSLKERVKQERALAGC